MFWLMACSRVTVSDGEEAIRADPAPIWNPAAGSQRAFTPSRPGFARDEDQHALPAMKDDTGPRKDAVRKPAGGRILSTGSVVLNLTQVKIG
jgi:hypothetical protein